MKHTKSKTETNIKTMRRVTLKYSDFKYEPADEDDEDNPETWTAHIEGITKDGTMPKGRLPFVLYIGKKKMFTISEKGGPVYEGKELPNVQVDSNGGVVDRIWFYEDPKKYM